MIATQPLDQSPGRCNIRLALGADEATHVETLVAAAQLPEAARRRVETAAIRLVEGVRGRRARLGDLDTFLAEYRLSTREGVVLMCLAEALLRIPDADTADRLIRDKIGGADWAGHLGQSDATFVNASTWALMLTGRLMRLEPGEGGAVGALGRLVAKAG